MTEPTRSVAVVTGAAQGLGEAIATRFLADSFKVVFADVNAAPVERTANATDPSGEQAVAVELDVRRLDSVRGVSRLCRRAVGPCGRVGEQRCPHRRAAVP